MPPPGARWRVGGRWSPGKIIVHNDAGPFNAALRDGRLTGFFDWDFAGPCTARSDVSWMALAWVPLPARRVAAAGDGLYARLLRDGVADDVDEAVRELDDFFG